MASVVGPSQRTQEPKGLHCLGFHVTEPHAHLRRKSSHFQGLCKKLVLGKVAKFIVSILPSGVSASRQMCGCPGVSPESPPTKWLLIPLHIPEKVMALTALIVHKVTMVENGVKYNPR